METEVEETKKDAVETMDMSVLDNVLNLLEKNFDTVDRFSETENCVFIQVDGQNIIKVSVGGAYTNFFAKDKKVQFKHGSATNTDENIIKKVSSIFGKGDFAVIIDGDLATKKLEDIFGVEFVQTSAQGVQYFRCKDPETLGVKTLQLGINLSSIRKIGFSDFQSPKTFENGGDVDEYFNAVKANAEANAEATHSILTLLDKV